MQRHTTLPDADRAPDDATIAASHGGAPTRPQTRDEVEAVYLERLDRFGQLRDQYNRRRYVAANTGVVLLIAAVLALIFGIGYHFLLVLVPFLAVGFIVAFVRQIREDTHHDRYATLWNVNEEGPLRLNRDWDRLPLRRPASEVTSLFAGDLDVLGHASLQHLLDTATTPAGQIRLRDWLLTPAPIAEARQRQAAVAELAPMIDLRDELTLFGRFSSMTEGAYARFLEWAEQAPWLAPRRALNVLTFLSPALLIILLVAELVGLLHYPFWLIFIALNLFLIQTQGKVVDERLDQVAERQKVFQPYAGLFGLIARQPFAAPLLRRIQGDLAAGDLNADAEMRRLGVIMQWGDVRLSLISPILQWILLWNFHILRALETWQSRAGQRVRVWLDTLSELEALSALATLAYDNPTWAFPTFVPADRAARVTARNLAHPLLPPTVAVGNDVTVGPPGTFLLVTGSNMSGKSTLLRALGLNVALAQAGAPVCADAMTLAPVTLATSVRIQDSLEYGVSYYMAELRRLKEVVDIADAAHTGDLSNFDALSSGHGAPVAASPGAVVGANGANGPTGANGTIAANGATTRLNAKSAKPKANGKGESRSARNGVGASLRFPDEGEAIAPDASHPDDDRRIPLFLLDEILHGTNTSERQIAARRIIKRLLVLGATGIVSTHDIALADAPEFKQVSKNAHFTEDFTRGPDGPTMSFDYMLRPGIATSTNALKLMEIVGLPVE